MKNIAFFDAKQYDKQSFDEIKGDYGFEIKYFESKLSADTVSLAKGSDAVVVFVNDVIDNKVIDSLYGMGINVIALRCAGYNNVDFKAAYGKVHALRVPAYSPYAVAEHALALLSTLNRKTHKAYNRTREYNFSLQGLTGFDLYGKTVGVVGTGKIGRVFIDICNGLKMKVLAYDPFPAEGLSAEYVSFDELCKRSDVISLHCPLTKETHHIVNARTLSLMKDGVTLINTSRGALIDSTALLNAIKDGKVGATGLDVYEEESEFFFEDFSGSVMKDDVLARLISMPNVLVSSHQAFLTKEALKNIARTTLDNLKGFFDDEALINEICYQCGKKEVCPKEQGQKRCF